MMRLRFWQSYGHFFSSQLSVLCSLCNYLNLSVVLLILFLLFCLEFILLIESSGRFKFSPFPLDS